MTATWRDVQSCPYAAPRRALLRGNGRAPSIAPIASLYRPAPPWAAALWPMHALRRCHRYPVAAVHRGDSRVAVLPGPPSKRRRLRLRRRRVRNTSSRHDAQEPRRRCLIVPKSRRSTRRPGEASCTDPLRPRRGCPAGRRQFRSLCVAGARRARRGRLLLASARGPTSSRSPVSLWPRTLHAGL